MPSSQNPTMHSNNNAFSDISSLNEDHNKYSSIRREQTNPGSPARQYENVYPAMDFKELQIQP